MRGLRDVVVVLCALLALVAVHFGSGAAIIGIDLGTNYIKVALVRPGRTFEIVLNEASKRKSETMVAIENGQRLYASNAFGLYSRKPGNAVVRLRDLIGRSKDHPALKHLEKHGYDYDIVFDESPEESSFKLSFAKGTDDEGLFRVEELLAMILKYAKHIAEEYAQEGTKIHDCVLTVPSFFNQFERQSLLESAEIAGLNVLTLVDENTAAAIQHGIYREFPNETTKVLLYNMGAASTQASIVEFWGKPVKGSKNLTQLAVLSKGWDTTLGGDEFDLEVANLLAEQFDKQNENKESIRTIPRPMARIRKQAQKTKEVLSANDMIPVVIESLHNDIDLRTSVTRSWLEEASKHILDRVTKPVEDALSKAGLTLSDIDSVELIGGGVRVPKVKKILKEYLGGLELGSHLNGDEAMALGAVFMGANLSKAFRVRGVGLTDILAAEIGVDLEDLTPLSEEEGQWQKHALLFKTTSPLHSRKVVTFHHDRDISCTLKDETYDEAVAFSQYEIKGIGAANEEYGHLGKPKISLSYFLSLNGTVSLVKAEATFVEIVEIETPAGTVENSTEADTEAKSELNEDSESEETTKDEDTDEGKGDDDTAVDAEESESSEEDAGEADDSTTDEDADEEATSNEESTTGEGSEEKKPKTKKKVHRIPLKIGQTNRGVAFVGMDVAAKDAAKATLAKFEEAEEALKMHEREKNDLESFIFACRDRLRSNEEDVSKVTTEEVVSTLFVDLEDVEDWLYDEGEDADISVYREKKQALAKRVNSIFARVAESVQRPLVIKAARELIVAVDAQRANWTVERPWISPEELAALETECVSFISWLDEEEAKQNDLPASEEPVLTTNGITQKLESIQTRVEQILKRRMPRPKKPVSVDNTTEKETTDDKEKEEGEAKEKVDEDTDSTQDENQEEHDEL